MSENARYKNNEHLYILLGAIVLILLVVSCLYQSAMAGDERPEEQRGQEAATRSPERSRESTPACRSPELNVTRSREYEIRCHSAPPPSYHLPPPPYSNFAKEM